MQISSISTNHYINTTQNVSQTESIKSFEKLLGASVEPTEISFEEYKNLSYDDLVNMYKDDTKLAQANHLRNLANTPQGDETFLRTLFDMDIQSYKNNPDVKKGAGSKILDDLVAATDLRDSFKVDENGYIILPFAIQLRLEKMGNNNSKVIAELEKKAKDENYSPNNFLFTYENALKIYENAEKRFSSYSEERKSFLQENNILENIKSFLSQYEDKISKNQKVLNAYIK